MLVNIDKHVLCEIAACQNKIVGKLTKISDLYQEMLQLYDSQKTLLFSLITEVKDIDDCKKQK